MERPPVQGRHVNQSGYGLGARHNSAQCALPVDTIQGFGSQELVEVTRARAAELLAELCMGPKFPIAAESDNGIAILFRTNRELKRTNRFS